MPKRLEQDNLAFKALFVWYLIGSIIYTQVIFLSKLLYILIKLNGYHVSYICERE